MEDGSVLLSSDVHTGANSPRDGSATSNAAESEFEQEITPSSQELANEQELTGSAVFLPKNTEPHAYTDPSRQEIAFGTRGVAKLIDMLALGNFDSALRAVHALSDFVVDPVKGATALDHSEFLTRVAGCIEDEAAPEPLKLKAAEILATVCRSPLGISVVGAQKNMYSRLLKMLGMGLSNGVELHVLDALLAITEQPERCLRVFETGREIVRVLVSRIAKYTTYPFELTSAACDCLANVLLHAGPNGAVDEAFQNGCISALAQMLGCEPPAVAAAVAGIAASTAAAVAAAAAGSPTGTIGTPARMPSSREARICGGTRARAGAISCIRELCSSSAGEMRLQIIQLMRNAGIPVALLRCASEGLRATRYTSLGALSVVTTDVESKRAVHAHGGVRVISGLLNLKGDDESLVLALKCLANLGDLPAARTEILESSMIRLEFLMQCQNATVVKAAREAHAVATWVP